MNKISRIENKKWRSKLDYQTAPHFLNFEGGTMLKIIGAIFLFVFVFLNISNAPQKDWTDDVKLDITFPNVQPTITYIDTSQVTCLAKNMYFEARSEGIAGLVATTQVVFNRLKSEEYPNTICGVIEQAKLSQWWLKEKGIEKPIKNKCQFSWFCDGYSDEPKDEKTYNEIYNLAEEFIAGKHKSMIDITDGAMWYHADYVHPRWADYKEVTTKVGRHIFYR